jgi:hypothetical protein
MRSWVYIVTLTMLLAVCPLARAGSQEDTAGGGDTYYGSVSYYVIAEQLALLQDTLQQMQDNGEISSDSALRLQLLLGGILGSLQQQASIYDELEMSAGGPPSPAPLSGETYYSEITPARQITLFSSPNASAAGDENKAVSVWIDESGQVFLSGGDNPDEFQQLSLKQGWEKDYDQLSGQIEQMLAQFMAEHAAATAPAPEQL